MFPGKTYRVTLHEGVSGHDVWALQIDLNGLGLAEVVGEDGTYGAKTKDVVEEFQRRSNGVLVEDGIAGPRTQQSLALQLATKPQQDFKLPSGLLRGITEGESGWAVGAVNWSVPGGIDCGLLQARVLEREYDDRHFHDAFNGAVQYPLVAKKLRAQKNLYLGQPGAATHRQAWEFAVLYHNWPYAADRLAAGKCIYTDCSKDTTPAAWVQAIGVPGVTTPRQWADYYMAHQCAYVKVWNE